MPPELTQFVENPLSINTLLQHLCLGLGFALVMGWHYRKFGSTLTNRSELALVFPFVLLTTVLIINVIKSSLALSLGLVGALSIVRFRTPIKEPEELAYLFLAIAVGLGLGANQCLATVVAGVFVLLTMAALKIRRKKKDDRSLFLSMDWCAGDNVEVDQCLGQIHEILTRHTDACDLRRFDLRDQRLEATYVVGVATTNHLTELTTELRKSFPSVGVSFLDTNQSVDA